MPAPYIPGLTEYLAQKSANEQGGLHELQRAGLLQDILAKARQNQLMEGITEEQLKDPTILRKLGMKDPRFMAEADRREKLAADQALLGQMRGEKQPVQPSVEGVPASQSAPTYSGGLFDDLTKSKDPSIAREATRLKAQIESAGPGTPTTYFLARQKQLYDANRTLEAKQSELATPMSDIGKLNADLKAKRITPEQFAAASEKKLTGELPALAGGALTSAGSQVASGMPVMQVVPGYGRNVANRREAVRLEAIAQIKAQNPGMNDAQAGQELANRGVDLAAGRRSVVQLNTMLGATRQAVDQLDFNVKKVTEEMDKLGGGGAKDLSPVITAIARGSQKWTGDPAYSALFYFMHAAGMESARILQGGQASVAQLHQGAADEAKKWADANFTTPKAWKEGVAPAMLSEGQERIRTYERAMAKQRIGGGAPAAPMQPTGANPVDALLEKYK